MDLLLQYEASPNSGGKRVEDYEEEERRAQGDGEKGEGTTGGRKRALIPGENEGGAVVTPLHTLLSVQLPKAEEGREQVSK